MASPRPLSARDLAGVDGVIRARDLSIIYIAGPGHGGPGLVANAYLEGTYSEVYPDIYRRTNHDNLHVRGYEEEGTTTTPFDMVVLNDLDRFHLVGDVIDRVPGLGARMAYVKQMLRDLLIEHEEYITKHGDDMPAVREWTWE